MAQGRGLSSIRTRPLLRNGRHLLRKLYANSPMTSALFSSFAAKLASKLAWFVIEAPSLRCLTLAQWLHQLILALWLVGRGNVQKIYKHYCLILPSVSLSRHVPWPIPVASSILDGISGLDLASVPVIPIPMSSSQRSPVQKSVAVIFPRQTSCYFQWKWTLVCWKCHESYKDARLPISCRLIIT